MLAWVRAMRSRVVAVAAVVVVVPAVRMRDIRGHRAGLCQHYQHQHQNRHQHQRQHKHHYRHQQRYLQRQRVCQHRRQHQNQWKRYRGPAQSHHQQRHQHQGHHRHRHNRPQCGQTLVVTGAVVVQEIVGLHNAVTAMVSCMEGAQGQAAERATVVAAAAEPVAAAVTSVAAAAVVAAAVGVVWPLAPGPVATTTRSLLVFGWGTPCGRA